MHQDAVYSVPYSYREQCILYHIDSGRFDLKNYLPMVLCLETRPEEK